MEEQQEGHSDDFGAGQVPQIGEVTAGLTVGLLSRQGEARPSYSKRDKICEGRSSIQVPKINGIQHEA